MINVSEQYKTEIRKMSRNMHVKINLSYTNSSGVITTSELDEDDVNVSSIKINHECISNTFGFGSISSRSLTFTLYNKDGRYDGCIFRKGVVELYSGLEFNSQIEYVKVGTFYISESSQPLNCIDIEAADKLSERLNVNFVTTCGIGSSIKDLCDDFTTQAGIQFQSLPDNFSTLVFEKNIGESTFTFDDFLSAIGDVVGGFVYLNADEKIVIVSFADMQASTGGYECGGEDMRISSKFIGDAHKITGITYKNLDSYMSGTTDYCISIASNIIFENMESVAKATCATLYNKYKDFRYMAYSAQMRYDPILELGDPILFTSVKTVDGVVDVLTFVGNYSSTMNGDIEIDAPVTDEIDLTSQNKDTEVDDGDGGGIEEEHDNLLLLSVFNSGTLPETAGNYGSITTTAGIVNLDCISSRCDLGTSVTKYCNQIIFPTQCLTEGTYTFSILCRRITTNAGYLNSSSYKYFYKILDLDTNSTHLKDQFPSNWATSFMIDNHDWGWKSFTFSISSTIKRPIIIIQCYQLTQGTSSSVQDQGEIEVVKAMLETGTLFTKYKQSDRENVNLNGTTSGYPMIQSELLSVKSGDSSLPICRLNNVSYTPGSSHLTVGYNNSNFTVIRTFANEYETGYTQYDNGIEFLSLPKSREDGGTRNITESYIRTDVSNNLNIKCNSLIVNGTTITT